MSSGIMFIYLIYPNVQYLQYSTTLAFIAEHSGAHDSQTQLYVPYTSLIENAERLKQQNTDKLAQNSRHASRLEATQQRLWVWI